MSDTPQPKDKPETALEAPDIAPEITEEERRSALPAAAQRALAEADERRAAAAKEAALAKELGGRDGPEPVRYGDWEKKGIAIDF